MQFGGGERNQIAVGMDHVAIDQHITDFAAIGTAVHAYEAPDGAGNAAHEFDPGDPRVARSRGDEYAVRAAPAGQHVIILYGDPGKGLSQLDDDARNPAIADDHVRA